MVRSNHSTKRGPDACLSMSTLPIRSLWAFHHRNRHTWAHKANEAFHASLSTDVRQRLLHKNMQDEAYVVVFGSTQVGKTTLLLDLMGVSEVSAARVSTTLRGGRAQGRSSTSTAMEYRRSMDERWALKGAGEPEYFTSDNDMSAALAELRARMESDGLQHDGPFEVSIPLGCFNSCSEQPLVRMLDLPGDGAQGQAEQRHVENMAKRYISLADLILLVGKSDRLDFLKADALALPGIDDWQLVPSRFRIITTYSFTPQSIREQVRKHDREVNASFFRERLIKEIGKAVPLLEDSRNPERFFPLEFGHSWQGVQQSDPVFHDDASRIITELKQQLLDDIRAATTPLARIRSAVLAHEVVSRIKDARLKDTEMQLAGFIEAEDGLNADLNASEEVAQSTNCAAKLIRTQLSYLAPELIKRDLAEYKVVGYLGSPEARVNSMQAELAGAKRSLLHAAQTERPTASISDTQECAASEVSDDGDPFRQRFWQRLISPPLGPADSRIVDNHFSILSDRLNGYVLDKYVRTGKDSNFEKDRQTLYRSLSTAELTLSRHRRAQWKSQANAALKVLKEKLQFQESLHSSSQRSIEHLSTKMTQIRIQKHALESAHEAQREQLERDLQESHRFRQTLDEAYLARLRELRGQVSGPQDVPERLMSLFAALHMSHAREELTRVTEEKR